MSNNLLFEKQIQDLVANQEWRIGMAGDFFRLTDNSFPVTVSIIKENRIVGSMVNMQSGDYVRDIDFDAVIVKNGNNAQKVTVQIAGGGAGSDRIVGEVSVINGEISRVENGQCFMGVIGTVQSAGNYSMCELWNPLGSGKSIVLNKISLTSFNSATGFGLNWHSALISGAAGFVANKSVGGANPVANLVSVNAPAFVGNTVGNLYVEQIGKTAEFTFSEPFLVKPGYGMIVYSGNANNGISVNMQWNEV